MAGAVFQENHQGQGSDEGADEEVQRHGVAIGIFFDKRQDQGTGDAGSPPGREDTAVDGAEVFRAEEVAEIGRHAREAAAIAGDDEQDQDLEAKGVGNAGQLPESQDFDKEEEDVCSRAAEVVGYSRPGNAAGTVHEADEAHHGSRCQRRHADDVLGHRRGDGQQGDAAGDVGEEEPPDGVELPGLHGLADGELRLGVGIFDSSFFFGLGRDVTGSRRRQVERRSRHDDHIDAAEDDEIGDQAEMLDQELHSRAGNEAGKAEAHDGQTRSEAPVFREPFDQSRYGRDIARSQADAADDAVKGVEHGQAVGVESCCRTEHGRDEAGHR